MTEQFPLAPIDRLIRNANANRVSLEAVEELRTIVEELTLEIAKKAVTLSKHAGKKTLTREDIKLAYKNWKQG
ncbi:MAG: histone family protein [Candidatus Hodarchaeales archaeon]